MLGWIQAAMQQNTITQFFGCVGSCGYVPPSVKTKYLPKWVAHICNKKMSASTIDLQK